MSNSFYFIQQKILYAEWGESQEKLVRISLESQFSDKFALLHYYPSPNAINLAA